MTQTNIDNICPSFDEIFLSHLFCSLFHSPTQYRLTHRRERGSGEFERSLTLPWQIDAEKVEARLVDGVLTVKLPKSESAKPKKVKVLTA